MSSSTSPEKGFFASLFDFGFTSFIALRFLKVIYMILVVLILLLGLGLFIAGLATGEAGGVVLAVVVVPVVTLAYLIGLRIYLEVIAMFFRIGDNTARTVALLSGGGGAPGYGVSSPPGYGPPAVYPGPPSSGPPAGPYGGYPRSGGSSTTAYQPPPPPPAGPPDDGGWRSMPPT